MSLLDSLIDLEQLASRKRPEFQFRLPASKNALKQLIASLPGVSSLPTDLEIWFNWHDGQIGHQWLLPNDNRLLMSISQIIKSYEFLTLEAGKSIEYRVSWLPFMHNRAGDYLVMDLKSGLLHPFWHDDEDRVAEFQNLAEWVAEAITILESYEFPILSEIARKADPSKIVILISKDRVVRDTSLVKRIRVLTEMPLGEIISNLNNCYPAPIIQFELSRAVNSIERRKCAKTACQIALAINEHGLNARIHLEAPGWAQTEVTNNDLEELMRRCITP